MTNRRHFLQQSALVSLAPLVPAFLSRSALAADAKPDDRVLVVIQLDGGNDGLNTVIPYADESYARFRRDLRIKTDDVLKLNDSVGLHPAMKSAADLFHDGRLSVVQGVGYPNPNRSHFGSMAIWHHARVAADEHDGNGWLGRAAERLQPRKLSTADSIFVGAESTAVRRGSPDPAEIRDRRSPAEPRGDLRSAGVAGSGDRATAGADSIFVGVDPTPVALRGRRANAVSLHSEADLHLADAVGWDQAASAAAGPPSANDAAAFVQRTLAQSFDAARQFHESSEAQAKTDANYPTTKLGGKLRLISRLLKFGGGTRIYYASQSGYDTHAAQLYQHSRLLDELADALQAFLNDLKAENLDERIVVLAFSEFGRRVEENGSAGTDHGAAAPIFLAGPNVHAGVIGAHPSLTDLDQGDLKMAVDFRQVYAAILDRWLGIDAKAVLGQSFANLDCLKA